MVEYLQGINFDATDLDSKGRAFETFMGSFFRGEFGQYFTPRAIVQFIVEALPIKNTSLVLDTSCGSGGFLLYALDKVRRQADKEYPNHDKNKEDYDPDEAEAWKELWHDFASNNLFGIEISEQIARTAKMNMIIHDDGHTNVISLDGLEKPEEIKKITDNSGFRYNHFDFIITNPPFGSSIKKAEKKYLSDYVFGKNEYHWLDYKNQGKKPKARNNQSTEVLFLEQCYHFLNEGGYLAVVLPDGILTNSSMQYVRDQLEDWYQLIAVVSMPQTAFSATGAGVKSSVLFVKKHSR
nr:N-6 DNA methylase [Saprospiraceae bacterium]